VNEKIRQTLRNGTVPWSAPLFPTEFWLVSHNNKFILEIPGTQYEECDL